MAGGKRANGTGSIGRRADGRWEARYSVHDDTGRLVRQHIYGVTRRAVEDRLIDALRDRNHGALAVTGGRGPTFASHVEVWLAGASLRVRPRTAEKYRQLLTDHAVPALGSLPIARLEVGHINRLLAAKAAAGLAPATVAGLRTAIRTTLAAAVRQGTLTRNVGALADAPNVPDPQRPVLSTQEAQLFLAAAQSDSDGPLWTLALTTACRVGELLGLRWSDYDPEQRVLQISRALQRLNGAWLFVEPKTHRATRAVPLSALAGAALARQRALQAAARLAAGRRWNGEWGDLVFTTQFGGPRLGPAVARHLRQRLAALGLPSAGFHGLRRTAATLLADSGVPVQTVGDYLGDGVTTTLRHYIRSVPSRRRAAAEVLEALLVGASSPTG